MTNCRPSLTHPEHLKRLCEKIATELNGCCRPVTIVPLPPDEADTRPSVLAVTLTTGC